MTRRGMGCLSKREIEGGKRETLPKLTTRVASLDA